MILAAFPTGVANITVNGLHQWDYGQQLKIKAPDLPAMVEVHFACAGMDEAIVRPCSVANGEGTVAIPDKCLEQSAPVYAWIYEIDGTAGTTTKTILLNIIERTRPQTGEDIPVEISDKYTEAITAMNDAAKAVGEQIEKLDQATDEQIAKLDQATDEQIAKLDKAMDDQIAKLDGNLAAPEISETNQLQYIGYYYISVGKVSKVIYFESDFTDARFLVANDENQNTYYFCVDEYGFVRMERYDSYGDLVETVTKNIKIALLWCV